MFLTKKTKKTQQKKVDNKVKLFIFNVMLLWFDKMLNSLSEVTNQDTQRFPKYLSYILLSIFS